MKKPLVITLDESEYYVEVEELSPLENTLRQYCKKIDAITDNAVEKLDKLKSEFVMENHRHRENLEIRRRIDAQMGMQQRAALSGFGYGMNYGLNPFNAAARQSQAVGLSSLREASRQAGTRNW